MDVPPTVGDPSIVMDHETVPQIVHYDTMLPP